MYQYINISLLFFFQTCSFGYHAGGWGKPPVDENGKPLYGDVFGTQSTDFQVQYSVQKGPWDH